MFRSRWGALLFVALSAAGAASLVGGEEEDGVLLQTAEQIQERRDTLESLQREMAAPGIAGPDTVTGGPVDFSEDEELIDTAEGFDPSPIEDGLPPDGEVVEPDEVVIVPSDGGQIEQ